MKDKKKKVLVADDSLFIRNVLRDVLKKKYKVVMARSGAMTLDKFHKEKPDLILLDIVMPEGEEEGIRVLKEVMSRKKDGNKPKVVMITAVGHEAMVNECKKLGVEDYIMKPFDENEVAKLVDKCLER